MPQAWKFLISFSLLNDLLYESLDFLSLCENEILRNLAVKVCVSLTELGLFKYLRAKLLP